MASYGEQKLAYAIRKPGEAHATAQVVALQFRAAPGVVKEMQDALALDDLVLRWIMKKEPQGGVPSVGHFRRAMRRAARELADKEALAARAGAGEGEDGGEGEAPPPAAAADEGGGTAAGPPPGG